MKVSNETKVGAFTAIVITLLVIGFNFIKGNDLFNSTNNYYAIYDKVEGLTPSNPVMINGFKVGQVKKIELVGDVNPKFRVTIQAKSDMKIPSDSRLTIFASNLMGEKAIRIDLGKSGQFAEDDATLEGYVEPGFLEAFSGDIEPLKDQLGSLISSVDTFARSANNMVNEQARRDLQATLANLKDISAELKNKQLVKVDQILAEASRLMKTLSRNEKLIERTLANLHDIADSVKAANIALTVKNANAAVEEVNVMLDKINKGEGSLGLLVNDPKLYQNLESSSKSLDELLKDLKARPKRYVHFSVFGGKGDKGEKGEKGDKGAK